jgi:hypothetical protein
MLGCEAKRHRSDLLPRSAEHDALGHARQGHVRYAAQSVVLDDAIECGAVPDGPQLVPAIKRVTRRTGQVPGAVTADRGYGQAAVERDLRELGVRTWRSRQAPPSPARKVIEHSRGFRKLVNGGPGAKAGSATSSAATAGTGPSRTAGMAPPSGAGTGYSPTTRSRSAPWPDDPAQPTLELAAA